MREVLNYYFDKCSNLKWEIKFYCNFIFNKNFRINLSVNKKLKNIHKGERCFIVGNGPSLKKLNLSKITNEITFTVNNIVNDRPIYETINTDYHILIDPLYYSLNDELPEDDSIINILKTINYKNKKPICFISYEGFFSFSKYGLNKLLDLAYIYQHRTLTHNFSGKIDLSKNIPSSQNVIQAAIFTAIYMGIKEVYLIGVDMTSVFLTFERNEFGEKEIIKEFHAYKYNENEMKKMLRDSYDNEVILRDYLKTFTLFRYIKQYCLKNNIKIFNATKGGGLDVFKRIDFDSLFIE